MFQKIILSFILISFLAACHTSKKNNGSSTSPTNVATNRANLIDGNWEVNYLMNTAKPTEEKAAAVNPTVSFNSKEGMVSGNAGCNNFSGGFRIEENKIIWIGEMALTRKMCPEMRLEQVFIETLRKAQTYSVTEQGNTLNLLMGDIGIMRLSRK